MNVKASAVASATLCAALMIGGQMALAETVRPKARPDLVAVAVQVSPAAAVSRPVARPQTPVIQPRPSVSEGAPLPRASEAPAKSAAVKKTPTVRDPNRGSVTNLPLPRFVSLKTGEGNARRGPGLTHRIDWVFTRAGMPLRITAEYEHWRRIEDTEGVGGWIHYSLLSGVRSVIVAQDMATFYTQPDLASAIAYQAESGVVGRIVECGGGWCRISVDGEKGWVETTALWGVDPAEVIE